MNATRCVALALRSAQETADVRKLLQDLDCQVAAAVGALSELTTAEALAAEMVIADAEAICGKSDAARLTSAVPNKLPILLIAEPGELPQLDCQPSERILGCLHRPFGAVELSSMLKLVQRNRVEFEWLEQQCQTYKSLLQRFRQKVNGADAPHLSAASNVDDPATESLQSFECVAHAVQEIDTSGRFVFSNPAHCRMHGYHPGELVGRTIWELLATDKEQESFRRALEVRLRDAPPPSSYSSRHRCLDGSIIDVQVDWTYKRDRSGNLEGFIAIITDITQQLRERRQYQRARDEAEQREAKLSVQLRIADEALQHETERRRHIEKAMRHSRRLASLGVFAAGIAHEINNPISAALSSAETALALSEQKSLTLPVVECLVNIVHATRRCRSIVKDLLKFASQEPTEKRLYSLNYVVKRAIGIVRKVYPEWPVQVKLELTNHSLPVMLNLLEIEIVIANLVHNAMEAAHGNPNGCVSVLTRLEQDQALLVVQDNGCGISKEKIEHIFDPFYTTRRESGGTGLGLSIVYAIVRSHRGDIHVKSTLEVGTSFTIQLPVTAENEEGVEGSLNS